MGAIKKLDKEEEVECDEGRELCATGIVYKVEYLLLFIQYVFLIGRFQYDPALKKQPGVIFKNCVFK